MRLRHIESKKTGIIGRMTVVNHGDVLADSLLNSFSLNASDFSGCKITVNIRLPNTNGPKLRQEHYLSRDGFWLKMR